MSIGYICNNCNSFVHVISAKGVNSMFSCNTKVTCLAYCVTGMYLKWIRPLLIYVEREVSPRVSIDVISSTCLTLYRWLPVYLYYKWLVMLILLTDLFTVDTLVSVTLYY